jgi:hypothetical protein
LFWLVIVMAGLLQIDGSFHHGAVGQDFGIHLPSIVSVARDLPSAFALRMTNPPGFYLLYGFLLRVTANVHFVEVVGLFNTAVSLFTLFVFWRLLTLSIASPALRIAAFTLFAFLPARVVQTTVMAADSLTIVPILGAAWLIYRINRADSTLPCMALAGSLGLLIFAALFVKYTFVSVLPATVFLLIQAARRRGWPLKLGIATLTAACVPPVAALLLLIPGLQGLGEHTPRGSGFALRSFFPKEVDSRLLSGPSYWVRANRFPGDEMYELLIQNKYSYPSLVHLGLFTDILDIYQPKSRHDWFGRRTAHAQAMMSTTVKTGLPISVVIVGAVMLGLFVYIMFGLRRPAAVAELPEALGVYAVVWFAIIAGTLPYISAAYLAGHWLPRLILPSIAGAIAVAFVVLDRLCGRWRLLGILMAVYIGICSLLQASFLLPWFEM